MPLVKARTHRVNTVRHVCRLKEPNRDTLVLYARFIGDTVDYVVDQLIDGTLAKDRAFLVWRAEQGADTGTTSSSHAHTTSAAHAPNADTLMWINNDPGTDNV